MEINHEHIHMEMPEVWEFEPCRRSNTYQFLHAASHLLLPRMGGCDEMFAIQARPVTTWEVKVFELVEVKE